MLQSKYLVLSLELCACFGKKAGMVYSPKGVRFQLSDGVSVREIKVLLDV